jgi:uncharacterized protein with beta-barrel porin domain
MIFHRLSRKGALLLCTTLVGGLATCALPAIRSVEAACTNTSPSSGETVNCDGSSTTPVVAASGTSNVTVNVNDGAQLVTSATAVRLQADSVVNLFGDASISTTTLNDHAVLVGDNSTITLNGSSGIDTQTVTSFGVFGNGDDIVLTLKDSSHIKTTGDDGHGASMWGDDNVIALYGTSYIQTAGDLSAAAYVYSQNNVITLNDSSEIRTTGDKSSGIYVWSDGHSITLNDSSQILTSGYRSHGVFINGSDVSVTLNDSSSIVTTGSEANAVRFRWGSNTLINNGSLSSSNAITVFGDDNSGNSDTIMSYGTITSGIGLAISLNAGNDSLTLGTGSNVNGDIDGGAGIDTLTLVGTGSEDDVFTGFETLTMGGSEWELSGDSSFDTVIVASGLLAINGSITAPTTTVSSGASLAGIGTVIGAVASSGEIAPGNSIGTLTVDGDFTQTGGSFEIEFDESDADLLYVTGATILEGSPTLFVVALNGTTSASGVIVRSDGGITGTFGTIVYDGNGRASLSYTANEITLTAIDATSVVAGNLGSLQTALNFFDQIGAEQIVGCDEENQADSRWRIGLDYNCRSRLWVRGFTQWADHEASGGNRAFAFQTGGTALGAEGEIMPGLRLGAGLGASFTEEVVAGEVSETSADGLFATLYSTLNQGRGFATAALGLGNQHFDLSRQALVGGTMLTADALTEGWLIGGSLQVGMRFELREGFVVTPSGSLSYFHQWIGDYEESGAGAGNVRIDDHDTGALRLKAQLEAGRGYAVNDLLIEPHAKLGVVQDLNDGGVAGGQFSSLDYGFELQLDHEARLRTLTGTGIKVTFGRRMTAHLSYEGEFSGEGTVHALTGGARIIW